ncbi:MAG: hypothetical protein ACOYNI_09700 [Acidimicrobiia bacterium]
MLTFTPTTVEGADGARWPAHAVFRGDDVVATVVWKGREDLPEIPLARGAGVHLGAPPTIRDDGPAAYEAWCARHSQGVRTPPVYVVDTTPLGLAELASHLAPTPERAERADAIRRGDAPEHVVKLADAIAATVYLAPDARDRFEAVRDARAAAYERALQVGAIAFDAVLTGEVTNAARALEHTDPDVFTRISAQVEMFSSPPTTDEERAARDHWRTVLADDVAHERLIEFIRHFVGRTDPPLPYDLTGRALPQSALLLRDLLGDAHNAAHDFWFREELDADGFALVTRALLGEPAAKTQVESQLALLHEHDAHQRDERVRAARGYTLIDPKTAPADPERIAIVHSTAYEPTRDETGAVVLRTRQDADGYPRASLHFAINHVVKSHLYAQVWDSQDYVVVGTLGAAVATNGAPATLNGVDTWWARDPGAPVRLPDAILVRAGGADVPLLAERDGDIVYRSRGFTRDDARTIVTTLARQRRSMELFGCFSWSGDESEGFAHHEDADGLDLLHRLDTTEWFDNDSLVEATVDALERQGLSTDRVQRALALGARDLAVDRAFARLGVERSAPGQWAIHGEESLRALAAEWGISTAAHTDSRDSLAEKAGLGWFSDTPTSAPLGGHIAEASPQARRAVVAAGIGKVASDPVRIQRTPERGFSLPG